MRILVTLFLTLIFISSCRKETTIIDENYVDNYIYEIEGDKIYQSNAEKNRLKTSEQYISNLYTHYFQTTIPPSDFSELARVDNSIGDKQISKEFISNKFLNSPSVIIPLDSDMRSDIEKFVKETYLRFYQRNPSPYELFELKTMIEEDSDLSPILIYHAFATSEEYKHY